MQGAVGVFKPRTKVRLESFRGGQKFWSNKDFIILDFESLDILGVADQPFIIAGMNLFAGEAIFIDFERNFLAIESGVTEDDPYWEEKHQPEDDNAADLFMHMHIRNIDHGNVHRDTAYNWYGFIVQRRKAFIGRQNRNAVRITCAQYSNLHIARRGIGRVIAERLAFFDVTNLQDGCEEGDDGFDVFLLRIFRRVTAIKSDARAHHLEVIRLAQIGSCGIGKT